MTTLRALSPAKLNLFLHVTRRRPDGYHQLQTVFQLLDWGDDMVFELRDEPGVTLSGDTSDLRPQDNLILRAAAALEQPTMGAHISVVKRIPRGGGLGGGSSNAGTTLRALNRLWSLGLTDAELMSLATPLGADVPVFARGLSAWAEGIGENLTPIALPPRWFVVVQPECEVSTAEIFAHPQLTRNTAPITVQALFSGAGRNDLQDVVTALYPEVRNALEWLLEQASGARMTGSGACLFAALETEHEARQIAERAPPGLKIAVARGVDQLPEMYEAS